MSNSILIEKQAPEDKFKRMTLGLELNRIGEKRPDDLLNHLRSMTADQIWSFVSKIDEVTPTPLLNRLAVESLPEITGLRYDTTLRMIGLLVKGSDKAPENEKSQLIAGVIKLINGYRHRTNLNLLTGLSDALGDEGVYLVKGNEAFDRSCAEHLQRALEKPFGLRDLSSMVRNSGVLQIPKALSILVDRIQADNPHFIRTLVSDLYYQEALTPAMIAPIRQAFGDKVFHERGYYTILDENGKSSLAGITEVFGEETVITPDTLEEAMANANGDVKKCKFLSIFTHGLNDAPFENWPKSRDFVYKNLKALTVSTDSIFQRTFIKHCAADGHAQPVMDVIIGKLKVYMIDADRQHERSDYGSFDYESCSQAQILNRTFDQFYKANWRDAQLNKWRWNAIDLIQETGILEFSDLAEGANARLMGELIEAIGEPENKAEILQKLVRFRGAWFTQELGF